MDPNLYFTYVLACIAIVIVPGPTVTVIIANSLRHGPMAGLLNVVGTQVGLAIMLCVLAFGLSTIVNNLGVVFDWLRLLGAAYLVWLGVRMWRSDGSLGSSAGRKPNGGFFWQGFIVIWSNPKALLFFGAFIPQFIDPAGNALLQTILLGATFMIVATVLDGAYAVLAGRAGSLLSQSRVRLVERISGSFLIGGGLWLALLKQKA
ncbi:LysE family translocator [Coralliovum pocilloporae]|uniref:LysE family translocator n=1 Tax=Coralliovum pocilloporae TaxID=3066369 RepID=UPI0033073787